MPTIFASKVFQNQYKEWSKELSANPHSLETNAVVKQLLADLQRPPPSDSDSLKWRMRELKGKEILSDFTELFFETHKVTEPQAKILYEVLAQVLPTDDPILDKIGSQLILNEEASLHSDNAEVRQLQVKLDEKIKALQYSTKSELKAQTLSGKKAHRWGKLKNRLLASSYVALGGFGLALLSLFANPIGAGIAGLTFIGLLIGTWCIAAISEHKEKKNQPTQEEIDDTKRNLREINRLIYFRNMTEEAKFEAFIAQIDKQNLKDILSDDEKTLGLLEHLAYDNYSLPLPTNLAPKFHY